MAAQAAPRHTWGSEGVCAECGRRATASCGRCHRIFYCSTACQTRQWRRGHKRTCQWTTVRVATEAVRRTLVPEARRELAELRAEERACCYMCCDDADDDADPLVSKGCRCRGTAPVVAHVGCLARLAAQRQDLTCELCKDTLRPTTTGLVGSRLLSGSSAPTHVALFAAASALTQLGAEREAATRLLQDFVLATRSTRPTLARDNMLAQALVMLGRRAEYVDAVRRAASLVSGDEAPESRRDALCELAKILLADGDPAEAEVTARRAVDIAEGAFGRDDAEYHTALDVYHAALERNGKYRASLASRVAALPWFRRHYGADHRECAARANAIMEVCADWVQNDPAAAAREANQAFLAAVVAFITGAPYGGPAVPEIPVVPVVATEEDCSVDESLDSVASLDSLTTTERA